ncbi:MAG: glutamyl-tRNA reductase [Flavobacteriales bacterium]|jgi:glutamyl-tRNA reductase|nr:glutamyl-tRNA reductase [Flavobacteriales bacterium]MDG1916946.1 glutamyl-tRNA reductase [Flavobacteriales bacterium]|tara:strand:+ start:1495 stop:2715 length:1221 start_codon:yes stop_codon:yes gene_type:complete
MIDSFYSIGISHWNCPLEIRERFGIDKQQSIDFIKELKSLGGSAFSVSTCNRTQVFAHNINVHQLKEKFIKHSGNQTDNFEKYGFVLEDHEAIQNLFEVSTGIDSQILGDLQIFSQVKEGVDLAKNNGCINSHMDRLLQFVFQANKEVQSFTTISKGAASVAHAAVLKIRQKTEHLQKKKILVFGTGEIGQRTLENLNSQTKAEITIINRTEEKAKELAEVLKVNYAPLEQLSQEISKSDVIVVATASKSYTLTSEHISNLSSESLFIDLSVPRNIDPEISSNKNVELVDMDQLNSEADKTLEKRKKDIPKAKTIINLYKLEFEDWSKLHTLGPTIKNLKLSFEDIKNSEIEKYKGQYQKDELERIKPLIDSIVKKISSKNIEYLRKRYRIDEEILEVMREMYKIN